MRKFDKRSIKELKAFLYNSSVHDAIIVSIRYGHGEDRLDIEVFNPIFNVKMKFTFCDIRIALKIKGEGCGDCETILSLTAEEDFSQLQPYLPRCNTSIEDSIYLLFQMFSGDELHIVSREVIVT